ncbi:hypothetical protein HQ524_00850 [Candidatus Uhrbacteria bacterium]|nr:hypothetical protein [Candidatus Uhrbacteria bacterium]
MPLRNIMIIILLSTLIGWIGVAAFVLFIHPSDLSMWMLAIFYGVIFVATLGTFALMGTFARVYLRKADVPIRQFTRSLRQGTFFSVMIVSALFLSHLGFLNIWSLLLLVLGLACIELFFLTSRSRAT